MSEKELKWKPGGINWNRDDRITQFSGLIFLVCSDCNLKLHKTTCTRKALSTMDWAILSQSSGILQTNLISVCFQLRFFFSNDSNMAIWRILNQDKHEGMVLEISQRKTGLVKGKLESSESHLVPRLST